MIISAPRAPPVPSPYFDKKKSFGRIGPKSIISIRASFRSQVASTLVHFPIMDFDGDAPKKAHHKSKTGRSADKRKAALAKKKGMTEQERAQQRNPKVGFVLAFSFIMAVPNQITGLVQPTAGLAPEAPVLASGWIF